MAMLFNKKMLTLIVCLVILASGVYLVHTYSNVIKAQNIINQGRLAISANSFQSIAFSPKSEGYYIFQASTDRGTIQAFLNTGNSTYGTWQNGTIDPLPPLINGSSGETGGGFCGALSEYFIISNPDSFNQQVNYKITYNWTYNNYFALLGGISFITISIVILVLTIFKNKLKNFNKALENQE